MGPDRTPALRDWLGLGSLCLGFFMLLLDSTITSVALPAIATDLDTDAGVAIWVNSAYLFAFAVPLLVAGRLGDRFGHRRVYFVGLALFTAGSLLCALAPTVGLLVLWRAVQGLGAALVTPQCLTIIRSLFSGRHLAFALAVWSAGGGAATIAGPLVGGLLVGAWGWPSVFAVNLPIGVVAVVAVLVFVPVSARTAGRVPLWAVAGNAAGLLLLVVAIQGIDAGSPGVVGVPRWLLAVVGAVLVAAVLRLQRDAGRDALLPLGLFRRPGFVAASVGAASASFCVGSAPVPLMLALQEDRGLGVVGAALTLVPMGVVCLGAAPFAGRIAGAAGPRVVALIGAAALVVSTGLAGALLAVGAPTAAVAGAFALFGLANAFVWSPFSLVVVSTAPADAIGAASGAFNALKQLGAVLGSAVTAVVIAVVSDAGALVVLAVGAVGAVVAAALLGHTPRRNTTTIPDREDTTVQTAPDFTSDPHRMREVFAAFPTGVAAFAALVDGVPLVMIASSFTVGVSHEPPLVSVAVQRSSTTWPDLRTAIVLGVSVLADGHADKTRQLASRDRRVRFAGVDHTTLPSGAVVLDDAAACMETTIEHVYPAGDHEIVVLRVLSLAEPGAVPLVWRR